MDNTIFFWKFLNNLNVSTQRSKSNLNLNSEENFSFLVAEFFNILINYLYFDKNLDSKSLFLTNINNYNDEGEVKSDLVLKYNLKSDESKVIFDNLENFKSLSKIFKREENFDKSFEEKISFEVGFKFFPVFELFLKNFDLNLKERESLNDGIFSSVLLDGVLKAGFLEYKIISEESEKRYKNQEDLKNLEMVVNKEDFEQGVVYKIEKTNEEQKKEKVQTTVGEEETFNVDEEMDKLCFKDKTLSGELEKVSEEEKKIILSMKTDNFQTEACKKKEAGSEVVGDKRKEVFIEKIDKVEKIIKNSGEIREMESQFLIRDKWEGYDKDNKDLKTIFEELKIKEEGNLDGIKVSKLEFKIEEGKLTQGIERQIKIYKLIELIKNEVLKIKKGNGDVGIIKIEDNVIGKMDIEVRVKGEEVRILSKVEKLEVMQEFKNFIVEIRQSLEDIGLKLKDFQILLGTNFDLKTGEEGVNSRRGKEKFNKQVNSLNLGLDSEKGEVFIWKENFKGNFYFIV